MSKNSDEINDLFSVVDKLNPDGEWLDKVTLSTVDKWYDTGCYALNAIISGKLVEGGIPKARITGFSGPSMSGKSSILNKIIGNAQKRDKNLYAAIWDSEVAQDRASALAMGVDVKRAKWYPVQTINDCKNQVVNFLDKIIESKIKNEIIIGIDSLGNLTTAKEIKDAVEGKDASDMGLRAKQLKAMMRVLTYKAAKAGVTIIFTNHTYDDPAAMYASTVKNQAGGSGPIYLASVLVQTTVSNEKKDENNDQDTMIAEGHRFSGVTLGAFTVKNRFVPPFLKASMYNNFLTGLDQYSGLIDMCVNYGIIETNGKTFTIKATGEKLGYRKNFEKDAEVWKKLIPELDKIVQSKYRYNSIKEVEAVILQEKAIENDEE